MKPMRRQLAIFGWYFLIALPFFIVGISGVFYVLSPFFLAIGGLIIAIPLAGVLSEPFGSLFYSHSGSEDPRPIYSLAQGKRMTGQFEEALTDFETLVKTHPQEVDAWVEMLDIIILDLGDIERADTVLQRGNRILENAQDRSALEHVFSANLKLRKSRERGISPYN